MRHRHDLRELYGSVQRSRCRWWCPITVAYRKRVAWNSGRADIAGINKNTAVTNAGADQH